MKLNIVIVINYFSVSYFSITMFKILDTKVTSDLASLFKVRVITREKIQPRLGPALTGFSVYDICRLQTADCRPQTADRRPPTADCTRQQDC